MVVSVKTHYEDHFARFYAWTYGDFDARVREFKKWLEDHGIKGNGFALDLGAGHGIQTKAMADLGFKVTAVDFSRRLLDQLEVNCNGMSVQVMEGDIRAVQEYSAQRPELMVCCGDTLTHLDSLEEVSKFLLGSAGVMASGGKMILSFRDYSQSTPEDLVIIPVKSDDRRIHTCILDYDDAHVKVTDLLYEKVEDVWEQRVSTYRKTRINPQWIVHLLVGIGMSAQPVELKNGMVTVVAAKVLD